MDEYLITSFFFFFFILRRMGKNKALSHTPSGAVMLGDFAQNGESRSGKRCILGKSSKELHGVNPKPPFSCFKRLVYPPSEKTGRDHRDHRPWGSVIWWHLACFIIRYHVNVVILLLLLLPAFQIGTSVNAHACRDAYQDRHRFELNQCNQCNPLQSFRGGKCRGGQ